MSGPGPGWNEPTEPYEAGGAGGPAEGRAAWSPGRPDTPSSSWSSTWPDWWPDALLGVVVAVVGLGEAVARTSGGLGPSTLAIGLGVAVGLSRRAPAWALALVWALGALQLAAGIDLMLTQVSVALVAFGCARWGRPGTVLAAGLSIPAAVVFAVLFLAVGGYGLVESLRLADYYYLLRGFGVSLVTAAVAAVSPLLVGFLLGLVLRAVDRSRVDRAAEEVAQERRAEAEEIARLRQRQADLARDVHDVVGHSLAVILAQAESAQYRDGADTEALQRTLRTIATSARTSLQDVRQVLSATQEDLTAPIGGLDQLVEGVRSGGHEVVGTEAGRPRPMPPELDQVAYRVLQEMLTNALKHGRRGQPVEVERSWGDDDLRLSVRNAVDPASPPGPGGQGVDGMRRRLEAVGGRLAVRQQGDVFTATAWVPLRPFSRSGVRR